MLLFTSDLSLKAISVHSNFFGIVEWVSRWRWRWRERPCRWWPGERSISSLSSRLVPSTGEKQILALITLISDQEKISSILTNENVALCVNAGRFSARCAFFSFSSFWRWSSSSSSLTILYIVRSFARSLARLWRGENDVVFFIVRWTSTGVNPWKSECVGETKKVYQSSFAFSSADWRDTRQTLQRVDWRRGSPTSRGDIDDLHCFVLDDGREYQWWNSFIFRSRPMFVVVDVQRLLHSMSSLFSHFSSICLCSSVDRWRSNDNWNFVTERETRSVKWNNICLQFHRLTKRQIETFLQTRLMTTSWIRTRMSIYALVNRSTANC